MVSQSKKRLTVAIFEPVYEKVKKVSEEKGITLQDYVNESLLMNVERDNFLKIFAPYLSVEHVSENCVFLNDAKEDKIIIVRLKYVENNSFDGQVDIRCENDDNSDSCIHVRFALALPELMQLNIKRAQKKLQNTPA